MPDFGALLIAMHRVYGAVLRRESETEASDGPRHALTVSELVRLSNTCPHIHLRSLLNLAYVDSILIEVLSQLSAEEGARAFLRVFDACEAVFIEKRERWQLSIYLLVTERLVHLMHDSPVLIKFSNLSELLSRAVDAARRYSADSVSRRMRIWEYVMQTRASILSQQEWRYVLECLGSEASSEMSS